MIGKDKNEIIGKWRVGTSQASVTCEKVDNEENLYSCNYKGHGPQQIYWKEEVYVWVIDNSFVVSGAITNKRLDWGYPLRGDFWYKVGK